MISRQKLIEELEEKFHDWKMVKKADVYKVINSQPPTVGIDKQKLIEALEEVERRFPYKVAGKPETYSEFNMAWEYCMDCVFQTVESQPPSDQWIPCSERLPKFLQTCFITVQYGGLVTTFRAVYWESHWSTENENFHLENVTAWMPAEPYKGVK